MPNSSLPLLDLHTHSTLSDGTLGVAHLVECAAAEGVGVFALSDHDCLDGLAEAKKQASVRGMHLVPAVEISVQAGSSLVHLLGYGFDPTNSDLQCLLQKIQTRRRERIEQIVVRLHELGLAIEGVKRQLDAEPAVSLGQLHVARALVQQNLVSSVGEAFRSYLGSWGSAYVPLVSPALEEAATLIRAAGGISVLAHPSRVGFGIDDIAAPIETMRQQGLDGLEVETPSHRANWRQALLSLAKKLTLIPTAGSDFHEPQTWRRLGHGTAGNPIHAKHFPEFLERLQVTQPGSSPSICGR